MIKTYVNLFNTTCCLTFSQLLYLYSDFFEGEYDVSFVSLKGTELFNVIEQVKRERKARKYVSFNGTVITRALDEQLPSKFVDVLKLYMLRTDYIDDEYVHNREVTRYMTRKQVYEMLIDHTEQATYEWLQQREYYTRQYMKAVERKRVGLKMLEEEINRRKMEAEEQLRQRENQIREMMEQKKREEWLRMREARILAEMNDLDEEISLMEQERFDQDAEERKIVVMLQKIKRVYLRCLIHEQMKEYDRGEPFWPCEMVVKGEEYYYHIQTRTCSLDFKIVDPYHIYMIYQILNETAKAYRYSYVREKEILVLLYIASLDPSPNIEIVVRYYDLDRTGLVEHERIVEQVEYEMEYLC